MTGYDSHEKNRLATIEKI